MRQIIAIIIAAGVSFSFSTALAKSDFEGVEKTMAQEQARIDWDKWLDDVELYINDRLDVRSVYDLKNIDTVAIAYVRAFESESLIRIDSYPQTTHNFKNGEQFVEEPFATLKVVERHDRQQSKDSVNEALHTVTHMDTFYKEVSLTDFDRVKDAVESAGFPNLSPVMPRTGCLDGNFYLIIVASPQTKNRVYRHVCDENYASDIVVMRALFDLAEQTAPGAKTIIDGIWREIRARHQR